MSESATLLATIGWLGAGVAMIGHIVGVLLGWWNGTGPTWVIPLLFLALMQFASAGGD